MTSFRPLFLLHVIIVNLFNFRYYVLPYYLKFCLKNSSSLSNGILSTLSYRSICSASVLVITPGKSSDPKPSNAGWFTTSRTLSFMEMCSYFFLVMYLNLSDVEGHVRIHLIVDRALACIESPDSLHILCIKCEIKDI